MSQNPLGEVNPYSAPDYLGPERLGEPLRPYPLFCRVIFSIELLMLIVQSLLVAETCRILSIWSSLSDNEWFYFLGVCEASTGILMVVVGFPAVLGLLLGRRWGVWLAWGKVIANFGSIVVGVLEIEFVLEQFQPGTPEYLGAIIGVIVAIGFRLLLLGIYARAVVLFSRWLAGEENQRAGLMAERGA